MRVHAAIVSGLGSGETIVPLRRSDSDETEPKGRDMTDIDTDAYRSRLEEERARLTGAVEFLERETAGSLADEELAVAGDNHLGDVASATYDRELDEGLEEGAQQTLRDVEDALSRIEEGSYGVCEVCGEPIGAQRLSAVPWARLCIDDQRKHDA